MAAERKQLVNGSAVRCERKKTAEIIATLSGRSLLPTVTHRSHVISTKKLDISFVFAD